MLVIERHKRGPAVRSGRPVAQHVRQGILCRRPSTRVCAADTAWSFHRKTAQTTQAGRESFTGETTQEDPDVVETVTVVTTEPHDRVADIHHRMAVIIEDGEECRWFHGSTTDVDDLLAPYPRGDARLPRLDGRQRLE